MAFIATMWWLWLAVTVTSAVIAVILQARNMKRLQTEALGQMVSLMDNRGVSVERIAQTVGKTGAGFIGKMIPVMVFGAIASVSGIILLLSVVLNVISFAQGG